MEAYRLPGLETYLEEHHEELFNDYLDKSDRWDLDEWLEAYHCQVLKDFEDWEVLEEVDMVDFDEQKIRRNIEAGAAA